jgi:DNA excision repair protein ERCC-2
MDFDLDQRTARLSVGEFSDFTLGPRDSTGSPSGLWRAQLGTHWHQQLRAQISTENATALFEIPISGRVVHHGWTLTLTGRIDQLIPADHGLTLREIKTVTRELPADDSELRTEYPAYFIQLATYATLARFDPSALTSLPIPQPSTINSQPTAAAAVSIVSELHFVEIASGLSQTVTLSSSDDTLFKTQLERVRTLRFRPPFTELRAGQETTRADLANALARQPILFFEAPTGFGKTGVLLELALDHLRSGRCERVIYLTSKATGQLQVMRTLTAMTAPAASADSQPSTLNSQSATPVSAWLIRPKHEHCIHTTFHCSREVCPHLKDAEARWPRSGLSRFYRLENEPRDLPSLRAAGRAASICPYEITRAALPFNDVWIGDYNSPSTRGIFYDQPGFDPARTLLVIDEAHNLPARVADVYTHHFAATDAAALVEALHRLRVPQKLVQACEHWTHCLRQRTPCDALPLADEDDARELLTTLAQQITTTPLDTLALGQPLTELLWQIPACIETLNTVHVPRLWWSPRAAELSITCLDAAAVIGPTLRSFQAAILASATLTPTDNFTAAVGLDSPADLITEPPSLAPSRLGELNKRDTRRLFKKLTSASSLLKIDEARELAAPALIRASTPWRDDVYEVAIDARVDTSFQQRARHSATTAATLAILRSAAATPVAAFFPSYAYAETIQRELSAAPP